MIINFIKSQNGLQYDYKGSCRLRLVLNDTHYALRLEKSKRNLY